MGGNCGDLANPPARGSIREHFENFENLEDDLHGRRLPWKNTKKNYPYDDVDDNDVDGVDVDDDDSGSCRCVNPMPVKISLKDHIHETLETL